jgi:hypothetical protein
MGLFGRLTLLGRGLWKVKTSKDPDFTEALEKELEHVTTEADRARARARLAHLKGGEKATIENAQKGDKDTESDPPKPSIENPPKKTL